MRIMSRQAWIEQLLHRTAGNVAGVLYDGLHLGGRLERSGVDRVAALVYVKGILLFTHSLDGHILVRLGRGGQVALVAKALNIGPVRPS